MIGTIILAVYILGFLVMWRYCIGMTLHDMSEYGEVDGTDFAFALFIGTILNFLWPVVLVGRRLFVWWKTSGEGLNFESFFPAPAPVESKSERNLRLERESQQAKMEINNRERELGIPLTEW